MRIYEIGTGYTPIPARMGAATEIVVEELTRAFRKEKIDTTIIDIATSDRLDSDLPIVEVNVPKQFKGTDEQLGIRHKLKRIVYSIALSNYLNKLLKNESNVVLHFHNQYNLFFFLMLSTKSLRKNCKIIYTNHSYVWHGKWEEIEQTIKKRYFQEIICMKKADKVFVLNEVALKNIVNHIGVDDKKITLIDNGVNTVIYHPINDRENLKKKHNLEDKIVFIQVGSVCDRKNQLGAIDLLLPLMEKNQQIVYCYAGGIVDPSYKEKIDSLRTERGLSEKIRYFGEIKPGAELNEFYNLGEAMIFPSKAEGFSLVILEAMSAGVPVIINQKLEFKLSESCLKYNTEDDFVMLINKEILNTYEQKIQSKKSREIIEKNYSWVAIAKDYYKEMREE